MNFDERWYKNRVKVVGSKYQSLYDIALQEYFPDADGSLEGRNIGAEMIRLSGYIYFTLLDMIPSTFIGTNGKSTTNLPINSIFGSASFGWESPFAPLYASGGFISYFGCDRDITKIKYNIRCGEPNDKQNLHLVGRMKSSDYEIPSYEELWIEVSLQPDVFNRIWQDLHSTSWAGACLAFSAIDINGLYAGWSPVRDSFQEVKILESKDLVTNSSELPVDRFGLLGGSTADFSLHFFGKTVDFRSGKEPDHLSEREIFRHDDIEPMQTPDPVPEPEPELQQPAKRRKRGLLW